MYAWIWHKLPGQLWTKVTLSLVLLSAVGALLWYVIFPWATPLLPFDDVQVEAGTGQTDSGDSSIPGDEEAPDEIPYSVTSNSPEPSPSR
jgi:cytoskeletal protein RodZ